MLQNHLKTELPSEWRNLFKHHESYPEDYYDEDDNILIDIFNHAIALARTKIECDKLKNKRVD